MKKDISYKQMTISVIISLVCGLLFISLVPIIALFALDVLISVASVFDPLHQGKNIEQVWGAFIGIIIIQIGFPIMASIATGVSITYLVENVTTGMVYFYGMGLSFLIYCLFQFVSILLVGLFASELVVVSWALVSISLVGLFSIVVGLICIAVNLKIKRNAILKSQQQAAFSRQR